MRSQPILGAVIPSENPSPPVLDNDNHGNANADTNQECGEHVNFPLCLDDEVEDDGRLRDGERGAGAKSRRCYGSGREVGIREARYSIYVVAAAGLLSADSRTGNYSFERV